jgi:hypothetical protein
MKLDGLLGSFIFNPRISMGTHHIQAIPKKVNLTIDFYKVKTVFPWKTAIKAKFLWGHIS